MAHRQLGLVWWQQILFYVKVLWEILTQKGKSRHLGPASRCCHESIRGKTVVITGPTSGIGLETAKELALAGAYVVLACRRIDAGKKLMEEWKSKAPDITAEVRQLDLESFASVREFTRQWELTHRPIHVLINNAGIFSLGDNTLYFTRDGIEQHMAVNFLSPLLLTMLLTPALARARGARVVNVSSVMHEMDGLDLDDLNFKSKPDSYSSLAAYCRSKFAQVVITNLLQRKFPSSLNVDVVAVHPGEVLTNVGRTLPVWLQIAQRIIMPLFLLTCSEGARSPLYCATHPSVSEYCATVRELNLLGGPFYDSECKHVEVIEIARDEELARELWLLSLRLLSLPTDNVEQVVKKMLVTSW